jgi:hypothetical protein
MEGFMPMTSEHESRRARWARVHIEGDRNPFITPRELAPRPVRGPGVKLGYRLLVIGVMAAILWTALLAVVVSL